MHFKWTQPLSLGAFRTNPTLDLCAESVKTVEPPLHQRILRLNVSFPAFTAKFIDLAILKFIFNAHRFDHTQSFSFSPIRSNFEKAQNWIFEFSGTHRSPVAACRPIIRSNFSNVFPNANSKIYLIFKKYVDEILHCHF